ncbi:MAG: alpha/beta hydrolase family protein [Alphaproteobacteria bacterium]
MSASRGAGRPPPLDRLILKGPLGRLILRPWFDRLALWLIVRWYLPLSRGWAGARAIAASGGGAFEDGAPLPFRRRAGWAVRLVERRGRAYELAAEAWEKAFFGARPPAEVELRAAEIARERAASRFMAARIAFASLRHRLPPVKWAIAGPGEVARAHGARLHDERAAWALPTILPPVGLSHGVRGCYGVERWLRFVSPKLGDTVWARVYEPEHPGAKPPTVIFLHGIAMETEMWRARADPVNALTRRGIRVVRPEGPWHGRRCPAGWYGGEWLVARGPLGLIDLFDAWVAELALIAAWARETALGPVAVGGVSLGALASQLAATAARHWPEECRPDALLLVATSGAVLEITYDGALARALGLAPELERAGWSREALERWRPLLEPQGAPAVAAEKIVMLLGRCDEVTPYSGGQALARRWALPPSNVFVRERGHFSVSLGLLDDPAPLDRLAGILLAGEAPIPLA